jgi:hypothetical protein
MTFPPELTIQTVLNDMTSSTWLKSSLMAALELDPVDMANDAELLAHLLSKRCDEQFQRTQIRLPIFIPPQEWGEQRQ